MNRAKGFLTLAVTLFGMIVSNARLVRADDVDALLKKGVELRRGGKEQEALDVFQRAARIKRAPRVVAQVALAEQALGVWASAERDLTEALAGGEKDPWITKNRRQLEDALHVIQSHLGSLEVLGQPVGAEVLADGEVVGKLPMATPLRLPIGEISLTLRKDGYDKVTRVVAITKGSLVRENIALHLAPIAPVAAFAANKPLALTAPNTAEPAESKPTEATLKAIRAPDAAEEPGSPPFYRRWWFWSAVAVVAVGGGAGVYLLTRPAACPDCWPK
jgi:hypothetical protein